MTSPGRGIQLASESIAGRRPYQEDGVDSTTLDDGRTVVAVADGMGGHAAGEVASALALEVVLDALSRGESLDAAVGLANERVHAVAQDPDKKGMGTTLVVLLVDGDRYRIANVGDSRAYLVSADGIEQVTRDHSFVAEAMASGTPEKEAMESPWKDALTRSIGTEPTVEVDVFGPREISDGSALLLCTDGLYKVLSDSDVKEIFQASGSPGGAAQALVSAALEGGSDDNITVAIAEFGEVPRDEPGGTQEIEWDPPDEIEAGDEGSVGEGRPGAGDEGFSPEADRPGSGAEGAVAAGAADRPGFWIPGILILLGLVLVVAFLLWM
ncbi:MAG: protein phosphatase 2C domain-containing protein [Thermoanaerobaculia bacterium]|nr:protein phosphatase 2C domain-containing protein [Thermoanaerobaculia bacterium]